MATTSVSTDRPSVALNLFSDAVFVGTGYKLYLGSGGEFSAEFSLTSSDVNLAGADVRFTDAQRIVLGTDSDFSLESSDGYVMLRPASLDSKALSDVDPGVSGALFYTSDAGTGNNVLCVSGG
jgi:hypothetical protein